MPFSSPAFAGPDTLDRIGPARTDATHISALLDRPAARIVVLIGDKIVIRSNATRTSASLAMFEPAELTRRSLPLDELVLLGTETESGAPLFSWPAPGGMMEKLSADPAFAPAVDLRSLAMQDVLTPSDLSRAATALAIANWHRGARFCGHCGERTTATDAGWKRICESCGQQSFPRTDPVVIMLVTAGAYCVLGRQAHFPEGMMSALAGFVEPGETIEAAAQREIAEEVGLAVREVTYVASQPWPFPHSLMIACTAKTDRAPLRIDHTELQDARWFSRAEAADMLQRSHPAGFWVPRPHAIAHWLVQRFAAGVT